jgi:hypothetical protein
LQTEWCSNKAHALASRPSLLVIWGLPVAYRIWNEIGKAVAAFAWAMGTLLLWVIAGIAAGAVLGALFGGLAHVGFGKDGVFVPVILKMGFAGGVATGLAAICWLMDRFSGWVNDPLPDEEPPWPASRKVANSRGSHSSTRKQGKSLLGNDFP